MFKRRIKVSRALYEELKKAAVLKGYSSVDEFVLHTLEKAAAEVRESQSEAEVAERLKGLGYLG